MLTLCSIQVFIKNIRFLIILGLVQSFVNSREVKRTRFLTSPNLFLKKTWQKEAPVAQKSILKHRIALAIENSNAASLAAFQQTGSVTELTDFELSQIQTTSLGNAPTKQWVYDRFQQRVQRCDWNTGEIVPILATAHGTDESTSPIFKSTNPHLVRLENCSNRICQSQSSGFWILWSRNLFHILCLVLLPLCRIQTLTMHCYLLCCSWKRFPCVSSVLNFIFKTLF